VPHSTRASCTKLGGTKESPEVVAELAIGRTTFWVSDEAPAYGNHSPESLDDCTVRLLLRVEDPKAIHARALTLGAKQLAPVEQSHGWLVGRISDPFGHHRPGLRLWDVGKSISDFAFGIAG
jgi:PhnB protein